MTPGPPLARAAIVAVGSELLGTTRLDTNSLYLTGRLSALGIRVVFKTVIGDDREELTRALRGALAYVDVVIVTGGLGPTDDDVTRDAVADLLGVPLDEDTAIVGRIAARFAARGLRMPENKGKIPFFAGSRGKAPFASPLSSLDIVLSVRGLMDQPAHPTGSFVSRPC